MYLKKILIENVGPIEKLDIELPFHKEGGADKNPKPLILVGQNGSGKSTILSFVVNAFFDMKRLSYDMQDEIEMTSTFRFRSSLQIKSGAKYCWSKFVFDDNVSSVEFGTSLLEGELTEDLKKKKEEAGKWDYKFSSGGKKDLYKKGVFLYFPPNRSEDPNWFYANGLNLKPEFKDPEQLADKTDREIIQKSPLKKIKNWLLDLLLDEYGLKDQKAAALRSSVESLTQDLLGKPSPVRFGFCERRNRKIQVVETSSNTMVCPDLFAMSSGEVSLFCMFCAILRDADFRLADLVADLSFNKTQDIEGIVVIDEIDLHLHTNLQAEVLPKLISLFPKIQFIITTHSPIFLLGMENLKDEKGDKVFGDGNFVIREISGGKEKEIKAEDFSEYKEVFELIKIRNSNENILVPEGKLDIKYIERAAELLNKADILKQFDFGHVEGAGQLDNLWGEKEKSLKLVKKKVVLLYDCDTDKAGKNANYQNKKDESFPAENPWIFKRVIPMQVSNSFKTGIENLFPDSVMERLKELGYVEYVEPASERVNGVLRQGVSNFYRIGGVSKSEQYSSKKQICEHLCSKENQNAASDFANFVVIFDAIEKILNPNSKSE